MDNETLKLKRYLLGILDEREVEEIDLQILSDETLEEKLLWAESELIEDFLEGALTPSETENFHGKFLVSPERKMHLKEIAALKKFAGAAHPDPPPKNESAEISEDFFHGWKSFFALNFRPLAAVFAILIIFLAIGIVWKALPDNSKTELTALEKQYGEINRQNLSDSADFENYSKISLVPGIMRNSDSPNKLNQDRLKEEILFRLALNFETSPETVFDVLLQKEQKTIFRQEGVRVYQNRSGREVRLILPKSLLQKGQYQIRLENPANTDSAVAYNLTVE